MKQPPLNLTDITLSQWVGYQNLYGQALDDRMIDIIAMPDGPDKVDARLLHDVDLFTQTYSYYTGTPMIEVAEIGIAEVCRVQGAAFVEHRKQAGWLNYFEVFEWNGDKWKVQPIHKNTGNLTKAEYDKTVDVALIMSDLQDGKHEAMYDLCAVYLRKIDEPFTSELIDDRRELMMSLPFNMALTVRKYVLEHIKKLVSR